MLYLFASISFTISDGTTNNNPLGDETIQTLDQEDGVHEFCPVGELQLDCTVEKSVSKWVQTSEDLPVQELDSGPKLRAAQGLGKALWQHG